MRRRSRIRVSLMTALLASAAASLLNGTAGLGKEITAELRSTAVPGTTRIIFSASERINGVATGAAALYVAEADGTNITRITADDGLSYDWPMWAMNGTKIVFTAQKWPPVGSNGIDEEDIFLADPDGSHRVQLTANPWRNAQPRVTPDGRSVVFSSFWPEFQEIALYKLDLATLQVESLSGRANAVAGFDADPKFFSDGSRIVFATSYSLTGVAPTQISVMNADGTDRRKVSDDTHMNVDPSPSPDGRFIAYPSYRGPGTAALPGQPDPFRVKLYGWNLIVHDTVTGNDRILTRGADCTAPAAACGPTDGAAFVPQWSPDGTRIGYISVLSVDRQGIYVMNADGSAAHPLIETADKAINWWDWAQVGTPPAGAIERIGTAIPNDRLLFGGRVFSVCPPGQLFCPTGKQPDPLPPPRLFSSGRDRWNSRELTVSGLAPDFARWSPDRKQIMFTAATPFDPKAADPQPRPPKGQTRHVHFTLDELDPYHAQVITVSPEIAHEQIYMMDADGSHLRRLTTPWTEDYMDAIPDGDARGNVDPDFSPDGKSIIFSNVSTLTGESFILRLDVRTRTVTNLTNMTMGAVPASDFTPRYSPTGGQIAFAAGIGGGTEIFVMRADGLGVRQLTSGGNINFGPAWSPNGRQLVYTSYRGSASLLDLSDTGSSNGLGNLPLTDWHLAKLDLRTGAETVFDAPGNPPVWRPVWSPDGKSIAFISLGVQSQTDVFIMAADGSNRRALQSTLMTKEEFVDWR